MSSAISLGNREKAQKNLTEAAKNTRGNQKKRIVKLLHEENWAGIITSPGAKRLGTIEGQNQHNLARRMKRLGARWTVSGGDRMARVLAVKANGELTQYALRWPLKSQKLKEVTFRKQKTKLEDVEEWPEGVHSCAQRGPPVD